MILPRYNYFMKSTRELILDFFGHKKLAASASELSQDLHLTKADIRYHLKQMLEQKIIEKIIIRPPVVHKGRPTQFFRLTVNSQANNFAFLAEALLSLTIQSPLNNEILDQLVNCFIISIIPAKQRTQQLNHLIVFLNEKGYQARWEAYVNGPRILFRNCPYAAILQKHPELCTMDAKVLSIFLKLPFHQTARIDLEHAKIPACIFMIVPQTG